MTLWPALMARVAAFAGFILLSALPARGAGGRLIVVDRHLTGGDSTVSWTLPSAVIPVSKGSGVDPGALAVIFRVAVADARGSLAAPAGFDGSAGWATVTATRARYRDRSMPAGIRTTVVGNGLQIRLNGGNLGGAVLGELATGSPSVPIFVGYRVDNGAEAIDHCVTYRSCTRRALGDGGVRVVCGSPEPDPACRAVPPVCGNGVREAGQSCDGGPYCTSNCYLPNLSPACCQAASSCHAADGYYHYFYLTQACGGFNGDTPVTGGVCSAGGTCEQIGFDPVPLCCQLSGSCRDGTVSSTSGLWSFRYGCDGAQSGQTIPAAICGPTGACEPG
jgi:hypothetical protein